MNNNNASTVAAIMAQPAMQTPLVAVEVFFLQHAPHIDDMFVPTVQLQEISSPIWLARQQYTIPLMQYNYPIGLTDFKPASKAAIPDSGKS